MKRKHWHLLIHQLPPKPAYLRAKIGRRLARAGAVALKNSVYVLPASDECLEDLQWIAAEAVAGGGTAYVASAEFSVGVSDAEIVEAFRAARAADYESLCGELRGARRGRGAIEPDAVANWRHRFDEIRKIDFFDVPAAEDAALALAEIERRLSPMNKSKQELPPIAIADLRGKTWVTRRGIFVDRLATAWLVRRFVDPRAAFRFVGAGTAIRDGEIRFDMVDAEVTHVGDRCTFEVLLVRLGLADPSLQAIAEIVHDIDLKDAAFARPEAAGVEAVLRGLVASCADDAERLERGMPLFDGLYGAWGTVTVGSGRRAH